VFSFFISYNLHIFIEHLFNLYYMIGGMLLIVTKTLVNGFFLIHDVYTYFNKYNVLICYNKRKDIFKIIINLY